MHSVTQLSFIPDNDRERVMTRPSVPCVKWIDGHWCWLVFGTNTYQWEPELERILLAAQARQFEQAA